MPRTKQVMKLVDNGKKRDLTYRTRLGSLVKKVSELSTLCGIDVFLLCVKPGPAGGEVTAWPEDRDALRELVPRFRGTPPERVKENLNAATYLQGELAKGQRKLVKARHCRLDDVLTQWDRHLDDLPVHDLNELYRTLGETLQRAQRRIAELGVTSSALGVVTAPEQQHGPAFPGNAFDFGFGCLSSGATPSVALPLLGAQDYHYLPRDIPPPPPLSVQPPYLGFHMLPSGIAFGSPLPLPLQMSAPSGFSFTSAAGMSMTMDRLHYDANAVVNGGTAATGAAFYDDFGSRQGQGFGTGAAYHHQDLLGYGCFDAGYDVEPRAAAGVWPLATPNNNQVVDAAAYQLQNDPSALWSENGAGHLALQGGQEERGRLRRFHRRV
uniref:MADS-box domain-containing protein n=1 Tax=Triticum aestivum TaxID=4565 RepID=A0A3B6B4W8_WHEAT